MGGGSGLHGYVYQACTLIAMSQLELINMGEMARQEEVPSNEAFALFAQRCFKRKTVENAKQELGLKSVKRGSAWYFDLRPLRRQA